MIELSVLHWFSQILGKNLCVDGRYMRTNSEMAVGEGNLLVEQLYYKIIEWPDVWLPKISIDLY